MASRTRTTNAPVPNAPYFADLVQVACLLRRRDVSPVELTRIMLQRIEELDGQLKSFTCVTSDRALVMARNAEREISAGRYLGPLHGVPIALKDVFDMSGVPTLGGLAVRRGTLALSDAHVVQNLEQAGAVLLGKLNMSEGAVAGYHPKFDVPVNPWNREYWSGISSSGCGVATAAGLCFASVGTDTGGSIRIPSMANGVVGLKPTFGQIGRGGMLRLSKTFDHVGPMARRTRDAALVYEALTQQVVLDRIDESISGIRIGLDSNFSLVDEDAGLVNAIEQMLDVMRSLGALVKEIRMPRGSNDLGRIWTTITSYEAHQAYSKDYPQRSNEFGPYFRKVLERGSRVNRSDYCAAHKPCFDYSGKFCELFEDVDVIISPVGGVTPRLGTADPYGGPEEMRDLIDPERFRFVFPASISGMPALSLPCGFSEDGMPYGIQIVGNHFSEALLCQIGHGFEEATKWHLKHPDLSPFRTQTEKCHTQIAW